MTTASTIPTLDSADRYTAPGHTPIPELIEALKRVAPLHGMEYSELEWLATHGTERFEPAGTTLFHEGDPATRMSIILKGETHVRRERGCAHGTLYRPGRTNHGLLPFSRMKSHGGHGFVVADIWALDFDQAIFPEMLRAVPSWDSAASPCCSIVSARSPG